MLNGWLSDGGAFMDDSMTIDTEKAIGDKLTTLSNVRRGTAVIAGEFPVRLETLGNPTIQDGGLTVTAPQQVLIFGFRGHPTIPNTPLQRGDTFYIADEQQNYKVIAMLVDTRVSMQAIGEALQGQ